MSALLLVDSSVWIEHLRDRSPALSARLSDAVGDGRGTDVRMCEPVAMELLAGSSSAQLSAITSLVDGLPSLDVDPFVDFRTAGRLMRSARLEGRSVRSSVDCLIAAVAVRHDAVVVHRDRDFDALVEVSPLRAERWN